jgi:hypothetical protein
MLQITRFVLISPGTGGLHVTGLPLAFVEAVTPVIVSTLSMFIVSSRLWPERQLCSGPSRSMFLLVQDLGL